MTEARYKKKQLELKKELSEENASNLSETMLVGFIMMVVMALCLCLICRASTKERIARFNKLETDPTEEEMRIVEDYKYDVCRVKDPEQQARFKAIELGEDIVRFATEWAACPFRESHAAPPQHPTQGEDDNAGDKDVSMDNDDMERDEESDDGGIPDET